MLAIEFRQHIIAILFTLATAAVAKAQSDPITETGSPPHRGNENTRMEEFGEEKGGYRLGLTSKSKTYSPMSPINIILKLVNTGNDDGSVWRQEGVTGPFRFDIEGPEKKGALLTQYGTSELEGPKSIFGYRIIKLKPTEAMSWDTPYINRIFDMTLSGEYVIVAKWTFPRMVGARLGLCSLGELGW